MASSSSSQIKYKTLAWSQSQRYASAKNISGYRQTASGNWVEHDEWEPNEYFGSKPTRSNHRYF